MEKSQEQLRFSEIIAKHFDGQNLSSDEKTELSTIAKNNGFIVEQNEKNINGEVRLAECYWICRGSNWQCNPNLPGPGCECIQVCI